MRLTIQLDGKVAAGDHGGARNALGPKQPQDVKRRRPVDEHAALVREAGPNKQTFCWRSNTRCFPSGVVPMTRRSHAASQTSAMAAVISLRS
jgi:hypothetical protein